MKELKENPKFFEQESEKLIREELVNKKLTQESAVEIAKKILGEEYSVRRGSSTTVTSNGITIGPDVTEKDFIEKIVYIISNKEETEFNKYIIDKKIDVTNIYVRESQKDDKTKEDLMNDVLSEITEKLGCRKCLKFDNNMGFKIDKYLDSVNLYNKIEIEDGIVYVHGGCDPVRTLQDIIETVIKIEKGVMTYERI